METETMNHMFILTQENMKALMQLSSDSVKSIVAGFSSDMTKNLVITLEQSRMCLKNKPFVQIPILPYYLMSEKDLVCPST